MNFFYVIKSQMAMYWEHYIYCASVLQHHYIIPPVDSMCSSELCGISSNCTENILH